MENKKGVAKLYKQKQLESASPIQLVIILYDAIIDRLNKAFNLEENGKIKSIEEFHNNLVESQNIITELIVSLDVEKGGDIGTRLLQLYEYINYRLIEINITKKVEGIDEVKKLLYTLREGWTKVLQKEPQKKDKMPNDEKKSGINLKG